VDLHVELGVHNRSGEATTEDRYQQPPLSVRSQSQPKHGAKMQSLRLTSVGRSNRSG
jgi:hypothetical protein